ncbi:mutanobactin A biosynthesis thioesterase MubT [Aquimarina addita]|uniref:Mutanobactin A biosynthesis thioesterase MubT n=1 Tax=Aquimarina addita TaxID=870485 RepID=A0ABP6UMB9_9FLAO
MDNKLYKIKIIALPFAGGNKQSYRDIEKLKPRNLEWITLELPGRGARFKEKLLDDLILMVNDLFSQIIMHIPKGDYIIYGHSMGTLLGYELVKKLIINNLPLPNCLFFTGRGSPETNSSEKTSTLPNPLFWKKIREIGGLTDEILECQELLDLYYPILKNDFKAIENYKYKKMNFQFPIPIHVCLGKDEVGTGNKKTSISEVENWGKETVFPVEPEFLNGDHFFIFKHPQLIMQKLCKAHESSKNLNLRSKKIKI